MIILPKGRANRSAILAAFGRAVDSLGGRYITTEDSGTSPDDMEVVRKQTRHVVGLKDRSGDPSPVTALGVARGIEAAAKLKLNRSSLEGLLVSIQGLGHVGFALARLLKERGCRLQVADTVRERTAQARDELGATPLSEEDIYGAVADIFAPCALGAVINDQSVPRLKVRIVAGAANNQLAEPRHGEALAQRNITYVPDYAINAGGLINVAQEVLGYNREKALDKASQIFDTVTTVLQRARAEGRRPEEVADRMAEERIAQVQATR